MRSRVTILDVAAEAQVSIASVSAALNDRPGVSRETRARILAVAERLGWVPSLRGRSLSGKRAYAVGLVLERATTVLESDPFFAAFIAGVESVLERRGYALVLQMAGTHKAATERYRQMALDHRVDGVFLTDMAATDPRVPLLRDLGLPAVAVNSDPGCELPSVRQDHLPGLRALVEQVVALGHTDIGHLAGRRGLIHTRQRLAVWRSVLAQAGLRPGPVVHGDFSTESGSRAAPRLLAGPDRPTAVVCASDLMAVGLVSGAAALGVDVPGDLSVTGFDGIEIGGFVRPALTTVATAPRRLGAAAAEVLLALLDGDRVEDVEIEATTPVLRGSLVAPRAAHRVRPRNV